MYWHTDYLSPCCRAISSKVLGQFYRRCTKCGMLYSKSRAIVDKRIVFSEPQVRNPEPAIELKQYDMTGRKIYVG